MEKTEKKECNSNNGVCCDVCCCIHNRRGCDCALEKIRVTTGNTNHKHFCGSFSPDSSVEFDEEICNDTKNEY